jgi:[CysO sulfur-carrier protein]-S-L-cysteine hydrolase
MDELTHASVPAFSSISLTPDNLAAMQAHVSSLAPQEACGLLAGWQVSDRFIAVEAIPVTNILHSPVRYKMEPHEQLETFNRIESAGWELVGIFHSHPAGPVGPSATDIAEAYYPGLIYLIWSCSASRWSCRAYRIRSNEVEEADLILTDHLPPR